MLTKAQRYAIAVGGFHAIFIARSSRACNVVAGKLCGACVYDVRSTVIWMLAKSDYVSDRDVSRYLRRWRRRAARLFARASLT